MTPVDLWSVPEGMSPALLALVLVACALKYAAQAGKAVHVVWGDASKASHATIEPITVEAIYREGNSRSKSRRRSYRDP